MTLIERWTEEIHKMKYDLLAWGQGINSQVVGDTFWARNKTKLYSSILFISMGALFYFINMKGMTRICGIILGLQVCSWVWGWLKTN